MKYIKIICLVLVLLMILTGCNLGMGPGSFTFNRVHICDFSGSCADATIIKWYDNGEGIEIKTKEYGSLFLSEGTYILFNDVCPICGKGGDE